MFIKDKGSYIYRPLCSFIISFACWWYYQIPALFLNSNIWQSTYRGLFRRVLTTEPFQNRFSSTLFPYQIWNTSCVVLLEIWNWFESALFPVVLDAMQVFVTVYFWKNGMFKLFFNFMLLSWNEITFYVLCPETFLQQLSKFTPGKYTFWKRGESWIILWITISSK